MEKLIGKLKKLIGKLKGRFKKKTKPKECQVTDLRQFSLTQMDWLGAN